MSPLRKQMEADMVVRGLAYRTRGAYLESVTKLAKFYSRAPDEISEEEVQRYLLHLVQERRLARSRDAASRRCTTRGGARSRRRWSS